ncbi:MAG TPA: aminotransferase class V-fold PLP-dependent enzyme [Pyrinomonadaceae bacterium]|nr:aminotransferase class V-fold PLP-dependent enzyme [Pyrinomonadaceae bacterium]
MKKLDSAFRSALDSAYTYAISHLENLDQTSVAATADADALRARVARPLPMEGLPADEVVQELVRNVDGGLIGSAGGRFFGWVIGGVLPAALAADWLTSAWQQNGALYATSPASAIVEETVGEWLKDIFGLPRHASFALLTGCQMAHLTCLAAARHSLLAKRDWDVEARGLSGAPPIRLLTSNAHHASFERAVRLLGLGHANVVGLPVDHQGKLAPRALAEELAKTPDAPAIVLLQAGDINLGAYDDYESLVPIAKEYGAWVHVDGAIGLWVTASERRQHLAKGLDLCDSWATDGHKWLNVPFDCGFAFITDPEAHRASMSVRASYLTHASTARDQMDWNPEWSRRSRSFAVYAALRQLGRQGVEQLVDRCCDHAHAIVMGIGGLAGAEVLWEPTINQGLLRFPNPRPDATEVDHDRHTDAVIAAILNTGEAFFGGTTWRGRRAMRVSVCNWQTSEADVERVIAAVKQAIESVVAS